MSAQVEIPTAAIAAGVCAYEKEMCRLSGCCGDFEGGVTAAAPLIVATELEKWLAAINSGRDVYEVAYDMNERINELRGVSE